MITALLRRTFAALGLAAFVGGAMASQADAKAPQPKPAMWAVSDPDTTVYLFGTIHLLPEKYAWQTPKLEEAIKGSQELVIETIIDEKNPAKMVTTLAQLGFSPNMPPIAERVPAAKRAQLDAAIAKSGLPRAAFDRMETWAAAFMLLGVQFKDIGLKPSEGVEHVLRARFAGAGKPVGELETNAEQLGFFDTLPEKAQRELLAGSIDAPEDTRKYFDRMVAAWARGDVNEIAQTFNRDLAGSPELKEALIKRRNANWTRWIQRRMASPGSVMVAVGAGHLAGSDSVVELLKRSGYRVRRVQ